jgi:hypothetical protein
LGCGWPTLHINHNNKFYTGIGQPTVHSQSLIDSLKKAKVLIGSLVWQTSFEYVKTRA